MITVAPQSVRTPAIAGPNPEAPPVTSTTWSLADHPDAMPDRAQADGNPDVVRVLNSPGAVLVAVAGANNAGVSAVIETFGPRGGPPPVVKLPGPPG